MAVPIGELDHDDRTGWEQREIDTDRVMDALEPHLRAFGDEASSAADLVDELSADELLNWLHRAGLLKVPGRPQQTASGTPSERDKPRHRRLRHAPPSWEPGITRVRDADGEEGVFVGNSEDPPVTHPSTIRPSGWLGVLVRFDGEDTATDVDPGDLVVLDHAAVPVDAQLVELGHLCLKFGTVERGTFHPDGKMRESDTTHTVMLIVLACSLADRYYPDLDRGLIAQLAAVHDVPEVYAGDTHTLRLLSDDARRSKELREMESRMRIAEQFPDLPWLTRTIEKYEDHDTMEAQVVWAVDKLLPKITCMFNAGPGLTDPDMTADEMRERLAHQGREIRARAPQLTVIHQLHDQVSAFVVRQVAEWHEHQAEVALVATEGVE